MKKAIAMAVGVIVLLVAVKAMAVRPLITDDASIVPIMSLKVEPSFRYDKNVMLQDNLFKFGVADWLEAAAGFSWGRTTGTGMANAWGVRGPLLQVKAQILDGNAVGDVPASNFGLSLVAGGILPYGSDNFASTIWTQYVYFAMTETLLKDKLAIYGDVGALIKEPKVGKASVHAVETWGVGLEYKVVGDLSAFGEIFSGNRFTGSEGGSWQTGLRYTLNDKVAVDASVGKGIWGRNGTAKEPLWVGVGLQVAGF